MSRFPTNLPAELLRPQNARSKNLQRLPTHSTHKSIPAPLTKMVSSEGRLGTGESRRAVGNSRDMAMVSQKVELQLR